jgi:SAM-dependent methyltransferase
MTEYAAGIDANRAAYSVIADAYARKWQSASWLPAELDRLTALIPAGARVADVGCGPGHHARLLRERGVRATGFDLSYEMLTSAGTTGVVQADMLALPVADRTFDAVWCAAAALHVPRPLLPAVFAEFARILRPGGQLSMSVAEGDGEMWEPVPYEVPGAADARRWYVLHRLDAVSVLLETAGFAVDDHWRRVTHRQWLHIHAHRR